MFSFEKHTLYETVAEFILEITYINLKSQGATVLRNSVINSSYLIDLSDIIIFWTVLLSFDDANLTCYKRAGTQ